LKILYLAVSFPPPLVGGSGVYLYNIVAHLPPDEVAVFTNSRPGQSDFDMVQPFRIVRSDQPVSTFRKVDKLRMWLSWTIVLVPWLRRSPVDLLHIGDIFKAGTVGWLISQLFGVPYIVYVYAEEITAQLRSTDPLCRVRNWIYHRVLSDAAGIIGVSDYSLSLLPLMNIRNKRTLKVIPVVSTQKQMATTSAGHVRARYNLGADSSLVLCVGRLIERKGQDMLIRSWPEVVRGSSTAKLIIVGDGPWKGKLQSLAHQVGMADRITFAGAIGDEELGALYEACDLFVLPHRELDNGDTEGCPTVFLEASAHGKPTVGGKAGGVHDAIVDGVTGIIVDGAQPSQVAAAVSRLLSDPALARRLGENGRRRVLNDLMPQHAAQRVMEFSREIVAAKHG